MKNKNVLVTGGAGFIGSNIVDELINQNYNVFIVDNLTTGDIENINQEATFYNIDIRDNLDDVFSNDIDYVIHHAAQIDVQKSFCKPKFDSDININGTINLLNYCIKNKVNKIIYASSAAVYGRPEYLSLDEEHPINPISNYGVSKYTPEQYLKVFKEIYGLEYTILRYSNAYGIRQDPKGEGGVISIYIDRFLSNNSPIIFGSGEQTRDFIYVKDIVTANILSMQTANSETINISTNVSTSINKLVDIMNEITNQDLRPIYKNRKPGDINHSYLNNKKAKNKLNWEPKYSLEQGLMETINYYSDRL